MNPAARRFFDLEADLGSDNEHNDHRVKKIDAKDQDEIEHESDNENLVDDSFVDNSMPEGDSALIGKADDAARELYFAIQAKDEQNAIDQAYNAVFHGKNHKF